MPSRILRNADDVKQLATMLWNLGSYPLTASWAKGEDRSGAQNRLMWQWAAEVADQRQDCHAADVQAEWKLTIGVPILRAENEVFRNAYNGALLSLSYEQKIAIMRDLDFPVTRMMTVRQMCRFMDDVQRKQLAAGFTLTDPSDDLAAYSKRYGSAA